MKYLFSFLLLVNVALSNEIANDSSNNIVKTSELELFLFKIGFESLLNDVENTKDKSLDNEKQLSKLNEKIKIIMDEIYKNKRVLKDDKTQKIILTDSSNEQIKQMKDEILFLKTQINQLKKTFTSKTKLVKNKVEEVRVLVNEANLRDKPFSDASIIEVLPKGTVLDIEYCNKYSWCKIKNKEAFIAKYLISL